MIGTRLGSYEITAKLGEGGMGEVYRATDTKLKREVALKVLPPAFTEDAERLARFEREAQLLAQLHHPNIASIFGLEEGDGIRALVMELVEGPTLAERLESGALPVEEALLVAHQIAEALEEAHEKGIVHRDLKPQNVKASVDGKVKVLDFGLAKAMDSAGESPAVDLARSPAMMNSPTLTAVHGTQLGTILGTAGYMAPEQARGGAVDKRADIWAFGVVLYETLSGEALFAEGSVVDTISAVMRKPIDLDGLPAAVSPRLRELLRRCLERDPKRRLRDVGEARLLLERELAGEPAVATGEPARRAGASSGRRAAVGAAIAAAGLIGLLIGHGVRAPAPSAAGTPAIRATIPLPAGLSLEGVGAPEIALSPDGSTLAFLARGESGPQQLYVRRLDGDEARRVPDSATAEGPFFSPDGQWVAFAVGVSGLGGGVPAELRKQSLETGLTQTIAPIGDYFGGVWREDGTILFLAATDGVVWSVPASGGKPEPAVAKVLDRGEPRAVPLLWPELLPGGRALAFSTLQRAASELVVLDLDTGVITRLGVNGMSPRYLPTGHLVFGGEGGTLEAVPFDAGTRRVLGAPVALLPGVARARNRSATFAVSADGTLVYATGYLRHSRHEPMRVVHASRAGALETLPIEPDLYGRALAISPDGRRLAAAREDRGCWVIDLERGTRTKVAGEELSGAVDVVWSADGGQLAWVAEAPDTDAALFVQPSDGRSAPRALAARGSDLFLSGWMPDGRELIFRRWGAVSTIERLPVEGEPKVLWKEPGAIGTSALSPDGRLVALESDLGEGFEIFLYALGTGERTQVTGGGGRFPFWSLDGRELYFRRGTGIHAVAISLGADGKPRIGRDTKLFDWPAAFKVIAGPDGSFYGTEPVPGAATQTGLELRTGWFGEVKRLAGGGPG
ncbi:MAG: serine/threonine-protein kinase [Acidobacteria bacterium]|nr:serine/threonine-protein kinase [Acidobacteriota bacterium]MCB9378857.1 serine/threonine-protein kinase [Holophagales bacterium]